MRGQIGRDGKIFVDWDSQFEVLDAPPDRFGNPQKWLPCPCDKMHKVPMNIVAFNCGLGCDCVECGGEIGEGDATEVTKDGRLMHFECPEELVDEDGKRRVQALPSVKADARMFEKQSIEEV